MISKNNIKLALIFLLMVAGNILLAYFIPREATYTLFAAFGALFVLYYLLYRQAISDKQLYLLLAGAIVLRLIWLFAFPHLSDDYARFVWDGRLSIAGYNPFKYLPKDIMEHGVPHFRADPVVYSSLNSQTYYTCYPPLLQAIFAVSAAIFPGNVYGDIVILKLFNLIAEIGSIYLIIQICKKWGINKQKVVLYAFNPIVIAELTGNLHYEGVMIFFLLATVYCWLKNKYWISILLFTAAVITKLVPLMFLPLVFFYLKGWRGFIFCSSVLLLTIVSWIPFIDHTVAAKFWSSIDSYFQESEYNASIYYIVRDISYYFTRENNIETIGPVLTLLSGVLIVVYAFVKRKQCSLLHLVEYFTWTMLIYYAFTTTVFPWYITPAIALAVFSGYRFPLVWSAVVVLSYYTDRTTAFTESYPLIWIEYGILLVSIIWDVRKETKNGTKLLFP